MRTIIIASDFSEASKNAANYAAQLSKITNSTLVVFHAWSIPQVADEPQMYSLTISDIEKSQKAALQNEVNRLEKKWNIKVEGSQSMGFAAEEIERACESFHASFVIMGMRQLSEMGKIFGSVTTAFIHKNKTPTLIIPEKVFFVKPKILLLATDLDTNDDWHELKVLKEFSEIFDMRIHILNVREKKYVTEPAESRAGIRLESELKNTAHSWHFHKDGDVVDVISKTANELKADWMVLIPHRLPWAKQLFHSSVSNQLAFTTARPILFLPEGFVHVED